MKLTEILKKISEGKELTAEEKTFIDSYKEDENRIPQSRLNQEIDKRKTAEKDVESLTSQLEELTGKVEELESKGLSDVEKAKKDNEKELNTLRKQVETLTAERDTAQGELSKLEYDASVNKLASKYNFSEPEYLGFLVKSKEIDLSDETATKTFMDGLKESSPKHFKVEVNKGGAGSGTEKKLDVKDTDQTRFKELMDKDDLSSAEASEAMKLAQATKDNQDQQK